MPGWMKWIVALLIGAAIIVAGWRLSDSRWFFWVLPTFFVVNCLVLIVVVLLQSGKAADLAGAFGGAGSQTAFGPRGAAVEYAACFSIAGRAATRGTTAVATGSTKLAASAVTAEKAVALSCRAALSTTLRLGTVNRQL